MEKAVVEKCWSYSYLQDLNSRNKLITQYLLPINDVAVYICQFGFFISKHLVLQCSKTVSWGVVVSTDAA